MLRIFPLLLALIAAPSTMAPSAKAQTRWVMATPYAENFIR